jgi:hypothetical protein
MLPHFKQHRSAVRITVSLHQSALSVLVTSDCSATPRLLPIREGVRSAMHVSPGLGSLVPRLVTSRQCPFARGKPGRHSLVSACQRLTVTLGCSQRHVSLQGNWYKRSNLFMIVVLLPLRTLYFCVAYT